MTTNDNGRRLLRTALNQLSDEYTAGGVFNSNPAMRAAFAEAREVLEYPDPKELTTSLRVVAEGGTPSTYADLPADARRHLQTISDALVARRRRIEDLLARVTTLEAEAEAARVNSLDDNDREGCE